MDSISSNKFSVDTQASDAMLHLAFNHPEAHAQVVAKLPEYPYVAIDGSEWVVRPDEAWRLVKRELDPEWGSWLVDAIEETGLVQWIDGEPYVNITEADIEEMD